MQNSKVYIHAMCLHKNYSDLVKIEYNGNMYLVSKELKDNRLFKEDFVEVTNAKDETEAK